MRNFLCALIFAILCQQTHAEVQLAHIFTDHMVLQRQQAIYVWGWARPGEKICVNFHRQSSRAIADAQGFWRVMLQAEAAGGPYSLVVVGDTSITLNDVMVGEVWLASGQSNMELEVRQSNDAAREILQSDFPLIRHIKVPFNVALHGARDIGEAKWKVSNASNTGEFSAVAYFFARKLHRELGIPIGIINASRGASNLETWLSKEAFVSGDVFETLSMPANATEFQARYQKQMHTLVSQWQSEISTMSVSGDDWKELKLDDHAWSSLRVPGYWEEQGLPDVDGVLWYRREIELTDEQIRSTIVSNAELQLGMIDDCDETFFNGHLIGSTCGWDALRRYTVPGSLLKAGKNLVAVRVTDTGGGGGFHGDDQQIRLQLGADAVQLAGVWKARVQNILTKEQPGQNDLPGALFNAMIAPLTRFPIRGVLWYQGEANVPRAQQYERSFPLLIKDWRKQWQQEQMPFYFVQLASFLPLEKNSLAGSKWAELRDAQRKTLKLPRTGMVVATDIGDAIDIHPKNKQAVGGRLALHAMKNEYGNKKLAANGPMYRSMRVHNSHIEISFSEIGRGLVASGEEAILRGFTIADDHQVFSTAEASIRGNKVIVSHKNIIHPKAVRYGWVDNPEENNLFNLDGLPASPFRTDNWPMLTEADKYTSVALAVKPEAAKPVIQGEKLRQFKKIN